MDVLIESLRRERENAELEADLRSRMRLHNQQIIEAKAPGFFAAFVTNLKEQCDKLIAEPRHPWIEESFPGSVKLNGAGVPRREILAELDIKGQQVKLYQAVKETRYHTAQLAETDPMKITVDDDEELRFRFRGHTYEDPCDLAVAFVRYVVGFGKPMEFPRP